MNDHLESLMRDVARTVQAEARRREILPELQRRVAARDLPPRRAPARTAWRLAFASMTLAAVGAFGFFFFSRPRPLSYAVAGTTGTHAGVVGDAVVGPAAGALALRFSDGSEVTVPERARAHVDALDARGATVAVDEGTVEVSVVHRTQTRWTVRAGRYQIHVTGTRFSAGWDARRQALTVTMHEGSVAVTGPGLKEPMRVVTGQRLRANTGRSGDPQGHEPLVSIEDADAPAVAGPGSSAEAEEPAPSAEAAPKPGAPVEAKVRESRPSVPARAHRVAPAAPQTVARAELGWRALAAASRYDDARAAALREGWSADCNRLGVEDLILLGDVARLARDFPHAEEAYQAARRRFPAADRPLYQLGRIAFEGRHDYAGAARLFDAYQRTFPHGPLVREAAGRLLEARIKSGDIGGAREAAESYLRAYPDGPHAALARRTVTP